MTESAVGFIRFRFNWKISLFCLVLFPLLMALGFWQLSRAQYKQTLQQTWQREQALVPVHYRQIVDTHNNARRVYAEGHFDGEKYWLLENKMMAGRLGYEVVVPFQTHYNDWLLVNTGWVAADAYRQVNPQITVPSGEKRITGTFKKPSDSVFIGEQSSEDSWPHRLLEIDFVLMSRSYGQSFENSIILLDADSAGAQLVHWQPVSLPSERHRGYAIQWFAMAFALLTLWGVTSIRRGTQ